MFDQAKVDVSDASKWTKLLWADAIEGQEIWLRGPASGVFRAYGPHTVLHTDKRMLSRGPSSYSGNTFIHYDENLLVPKEPKTMKQLAKEALLVQDACNLSGVVLGFSRAIKSLSEIEPTLSTTEIRAHPICRVWADKIASLTGMQNSSSEALVAFQKVHEMAKKEEQT